MEPIQTFKQQNYLLLEEDTSIALDSYDALKEFFDGYNKVIFTLMMRYFELPNWPTFIFFDLTAEVEVQLKLFLERADNFFVRTDTYKDLADNQGIPVCPRDEVIDAIKEMKKYHYRFVLILAPPSIEDQTLRSIGNCRAGYVQGEEIQEWTGPGFAEYHLAKDKFPRKATVHAYLRRNEEGELELVYNVDRDKFIDDLRQLHFEMGATEKKIRKLLMNHETYRQLLGKDFVGKEPTNDELEEAYTMWLKREAETRGSSEEEITNEFIDMGRSVHDKVRGRFPLKDFLDSEQETWSPPKWCTDLVTKHLQIFKRKCEEIGIDPNEKLLTMTFTKGITSEDVVFWDIHNLIS
jgi:hypothetical protein